jgi:hypothetical protein
MLEGRQNIRPVVYDIEYPLNLPENYCNDARPHSSYRNLPIIGNNQSMSEAARMRVEANMSSKPQFQMINNTRVRTVPMKTANINNPPSFNPYQTNTQDPNTQQQRFRRVKQPNALTSIGDKVSDFLDYNPIVSGALTYDTLRWTGKTLAQNPASGMPHLKNAPSGWRGGVPIVSDIAASLPGAHKHHGLTWRWPNAVGEGMSNVASWYGKQVAKHPVALGKVLPKFNAVSNALGWAQLGSMLYGGITNKAGRQAAQKAQRMAARQASRGIAPQEQKYQQSFRQEPEMRRY